MKRWNQLYLINITILIVILLLCNIVILNYFDDRVDKAFEVELNRVHSLIVNKMNNQLDSNMLYSNELDVDISEYKYILKVSVIYEDNMTAEEVDRFYKNSRNEYRIYPIIKEDRVISYVRIDYKADITNSIRNFSWFINSIILLMIVILTLVYVYVGKLIINPFHQISELPYELSKGHLTGSIKESPNRFFGKFIWGLNLLRENIDELKKKELELEKDKKLMILSISHDIKTPLSAIKLYARALSVNLYETEDKKQEIAKNIEEKSDEIEKFVGQIIEQTKTNFLHIHINLGEFYLEDFIKHIKHIYNERLQIIKTSIEIDSYTNCLLKGDLDRLLEATENVIENAIKYGNGSKIKLSFMEEENYLLITIVNWGNTLPEAEIVHIFESFYRGSNSYEKPGSGLGLYICKEILKRMDGDIYAQASGETMSITIVVERL